MTEQTCLSDLMERGMKRMDELGLKQGRMVTFGYHGGTLIACCALGTILLGAGYTPYRHIDPEETVFKIADYCPAVLTATAYEGYDEEADAPYPLNIGQLLYHMNDALQVFPLDGSDTVLFTQQTLPEILAWLKEQGL